MSVSMTLVDNCVSFTGEALSKALLAANEPESWKFAIINLVQALELCLKAKLEKEHRALVFENVAKCNDDNRTVNIDEAIKRLNAISNVQFTVVESKQLTSAKSLRNRCTHYAFAMSEEEAHFSFWWLFAFVDDFCKKHLGVHLSNELKPDLWNIFVLNGEGIDDMVERARERIRTEHVETYPCCCGLCSQQTVVKIGDSKGTCYVCGYTEAFGICASCKTILPISFLKTQKDIDEPGSIKDVCPSCGYNYRCAECGELFSRSGLIVLGRDDPPVSRVGCFCPGRSNVICRDPRQFDATPS